MSNPLFLDLFAGAGGLSEGFIRAGFQPVAHIELDPAACFTLRTRTVYHWLKSVVGDEIYTQYLKGDLRRSSFYDSAPSANLKSVLNAEISMQNLPEIFGTIDFLLGNRKIDIIIGGPPCQAYSVVGRARDKNGMKGDKRNYLYIFYAEFLKRYKPSFFVFENVTGILSAKDEDGCLYLDDMRKRFRDAGYETELSVLSAEDYGVLQTRKRVVLVGKYGKTTGFYPELEKWRPKAITKEIFAGLPPLRSGQGDVRTCKTEIYTCSWLFEAGIQKQGDNIPVTWHKARKQREQDLEIYRIAVQLWNEQKARLDYRNLPKHLQTHRNVTSFRDRFKVVASNLPCAHTLVAHIAKDGHYYIHPDLYQNRSITPREAARIQTFPESFIFPVSETQAYKQIGNAIPPVLMWHVANALAESCKKVFKI